MKLISKFIAFLTRRFYPRGTQRMLKLFFNPKKFKFVGIAPYDKTLKMYVDTSSYVEWEIFFQGHYEKWVTDVMKRIIKKGDVVMDAGANVGTHILIMAKAVGENGVVFAFEPDPKSLSRLRQNLELNNFRNVQILELALSEQNGETKFFSYSDELLDQGTASLYELPKLVKSEIRVETKKLDTFVLEKNLSHLDLIKIDTRGSDFPIIKGGEQSLLKFQPYVAFECNPDNWAYSNSMWEDMEKLFLNLGYTLYLIDKKGPRHIIKKPETVTSHNILAVPPAKIDFFKTLYV